MCVFFFNGIGSFARSVCLVTWPLSESEAGVDRNLLLSRGNHVVLMLTRFYLHMKSTV